MVLHLGWSSENLPHVGMLASVVLFKSCERNHTIVISWVVAFPWHPEDSITWQSSDPPDPPLFLAPLTPIP